MITKCLLPDIDRMEFDSFELKDSEITLHMSTKQKKAICPGCSVSSTRVHSCYFRFPADLPISGFRVRLELKVRRFFCDNGRCAKRTFAERLPGVLEYRARRTERLLLSQRSIAFFTSGEAGSRLLYLLGMPASPDTLLRMMRRTPEERRESPRILGVDDWSFRKGHRYGTILVDLEKHQVVDLLPERTADALSNWLQTRPNIEIVTRDRSKEYALGISKGAPQALQVADRWHLIKNAREMLERYLKPKYGQLNRLPQLALKIETRRSFRFPRTSAEEESSRVSREKRIERYQNIRERRLRGQSIHSIAQELGIHRETVRTFYYAENYPERNQRKPKASILDPFLEYLTQRLQEGCDNALQLWREIKKQGYPGTRRQVSKWLQIHRSQPSSCTPKKYRESSLIVASQARKTYRDSGKRTELPSARELAGLFVRNPHKLGEDEKIVLQRVCQENEICEVYGLIQQFVQTVCEQKVEGFDTWLEKCVKHKSRHIQNFGKGLQQDYSAVRAAIELPWSNGQTEGQITRLKLVKRQMYGRSNFDLLRKRVLTRT